MQIIQIRNISTLKDLMNEWGSMIYPELCNNYRTKNEQARFFLRLLPRANARLLYFFDANEK